MPITIRAFIHLADLTAGLWAFWGTEAGLQGTEKAISRRVGNITTWRDTGHDRSMLKTLNPIVCDQI